MIYGEKAVLYNCKMYKLDFSIVISVLRGQKNKKYRIVILECHSSDIFALLSLQSMCLIDRNEILTFQLCFCMTFIHVIEGILIW